MSAEPAGRYQRSLISDLDEPLQRFFNHAIRGGTALGGGLRLTMTGRIKVGVVRAQASGHDRDSHHGTHHHLLRI